jgi:hypothetical protein
MECRLAGETEVLGENRPQRHFGPSQNSTWPDPDLNPGRRSGKPATNRLSYGLSCFITYHTYIVRHFSLQIWIHVTQKFNNNVIYLFIRLFVCLQTNRWWSMRPKGVVVDRDNRIDWTVDVFLNFNNFYLICFVAVIIKQNEKKKIKNKNVVGCFAQQRKTKWVR